ncbi:MAG: hypothetical protein OEZ48_14755 [Candidatus Bathyarchaeota archaeon]|nr:hypothetical protein [Candidatus Bathyarchaeota archaeon]
MQWYDSWRIEGNRKAKERLGIFQKDRGEEDLPGFNEFAQYYRALGLKGEQNKVHALYKFARTGVAAAPAIGSLTV